MHYFLIYFICFSVCESSYGFLNVSLNEQSEFFQNDSSLFHEKCNRSLSESDIKCHTKNVIQHCLRSNQSYKNFEKTTELINATPGAKFHIPSTMFRIKKFIDPFGVQFHIWCSGCEMYSPTTSTIAECISCSIKLKRANSKYFVVLSFEKQLKKSIADNLDEILSYREHLLNSSDSIRDVHDGIQFKKAQKEYPHAIILPLTVNTDGARMYNSGNESIWPIQIYQNYLHPRIRILWLSDFIPENRTCSTFFAHSCKS